MRIKSLSSVVIMLALLGSVSCAEAASTNAALKQGIANYNKGYIQKAIPLFQRAVSQSPRSEDALLWLARASKKQGGATNLQNAQNAYLQVLDINPNNVEALSGLGEMLSWSTATRPKAIELLQRADREKPGEPSVIKLLAQVLYWDGRYDEALALVEPVADRFTNDKVWMATYASILARTGNADKAVRIFEEVLQAPESKDFYLKQAYAIALSQNGQRPQAKLMFENLRDQVAAMPADKQGAYRVALGGLAYNLDLFEESLQLDQSLPQTIIEEDTGIMLRMARALSKSQRVPEAIEMFQKVYRSGKMSPNEKVEYGDYLSSLDLPPENLPSPFLIETLYQEALRDTAYTGPIYLRLARYYGKEEGKTEDALRAYWQSLNNTAYKDQEPIKKEFLDFLKSERVGRETADKAFKELISDSPKDAWIQGAYAEFLSYQPARRPEAIRLYLKLINEGVGDASTWQKPLEKVLGWEKPRPEMIPEYQEILKIFPQSKEANLILARVYQINPETRAESLRIYQSLYTQYPDDPKIKKEWAGALIGDEKNRRQALNTLQQLVQEYPDDLSLKIAYGKLLSYEHYFGKALKIFDSILAQEPENRDALLGKGYTLMFDSQRFAALDLFHRLRDQYPEDIEVALGLAEANRAIGRYDKALKIIREIKPLLNMLWEESPAEQTVSASIIPCDYETPYQPAFNRNTVFDYSVLPYGGSQDQVTPENTAGKSFFGFSQEQKPARKALPFKALKRKHAESEDDEAAVESAIPTTRSQSQYQAPRQQQASPSYWPSTSEERPATQGPRSLKSQYESQQYQAKPFVPKTRAVAPKAVPVQETYESLSNQYSTTGGPRASAANTNGTDGYALLGGELDKKSENETFYWDDGTQPEKESVETVKDPELDTLPARPATRNGQKARAPKKSSEIASFQEDINDINSALDTIRNIQDQSSDEIHQMHESVTRTREDGSLSAVTVNEAEAEGEEDRSILKAWGQYAAIDQDTNPILSGLGRFRTESANVEQQIYKELRPMVRSGWSYLTQDGEKTTVRLRGWSVPNAASLSLTPQIRVRGGFTPGKYYQPRVFTSPSSTGYQNYTGGATVKYWDHLTLDADLGLIHFDQSESVNLTYQALARYDFNDKIHLTVGSRRFQNPNSLLSLAGYRPFRGPFRGDLVGQVSETTIFTELNLIPYRNVDVNLGYEFAGVTGERTADNYRNQAFFSMGYTQPYLRDHYVRAGYEFLYFGYNKPATLGYFNLDSGTNKPVVILDPVIQAPSPTVFGGYFSPDYFFLNNFRLDLRGSFRKKLIEYRLGGSIGIQTFSFGNGLRTTTPTSIASTFDANVIMNFTDWLAGYVNGEMLKGGGAFNRFRFGGGLIIRPDIPALSPVIGRNR